MTDLIYFINSIIDQTNSNDVDADDIICFLEDNNWFGNKPTYANGKVILSNDQIDLYTTPLIQFLQSRADSTITIFELLDSKYPATAIKLKTFFEKQETSEEIQFYIADFLLYYLKKEIFFYTNKEMDKLIENAAMELIKTHGDNLTFFLAWLRANAKVNYHKDYIMGKRYTMDIHNQAYDMEEYLCLLYYLFNDNYIIENDMYRQASLSRNYTDTWLYLSLHFICSLRKTDLERIYHPVLPMEPEKVIEQIADDTFSDNDARYVLLSITQRMCLLPFTPNKTQSANGVGSVKFNIPTSCEVHFGKLFALAEAHRQINELADTPIIRKISSYSEISRYMGEEIGDLFKESDFRARSATKSYLQAIYLLTDDILDETNDIHIKGYLLAALARSHKGTYTEFASTTYEYLKDSRLAGLTPEFVIFELFERGVMSFIPATLLKILNPEKYNALGIIEQTNIIKELGMSPNEIESVISLVENARHKAEMTVTEAIANDEDILTVLHHIGNGEAFSKTPESLCLLSALHKVCPYDNCRQCIGCKYEISTRSTFYLMISEFNRINNLYKSTNDALEKTKYLNIITEVILPKIDEMLSNIKELYGEEIFSQYENLLKENIIK